MGQRCSGSRRCSAGDYQRWQQTSSRALRRLSSAETDDAVAGSAIALMVLALAGCASIEQSMGRFTVKNYTAKNGQRVMDGQAEPKSEYACNKITQEKQDFGLSGTMDKAAVTERITAVAVDTAPSKGANYADIMVPSETSIMGFNINAFKDAQVAYYNCSRLPNP